MKKALLTVVLSFLTIGLFAQLNMSLVGQVEYNDNLSDIWAWHDSETGIEYAIVGLHNGVSIVSLEDPADPQEVALIPGQFSIWRDIKTWDNYAYVVTDQGNSTEGLTVIDLSDLPNSAPYFHWTPDLPGLGVLEHCHNLYIDEFGYCYLAGCDVNGGGNLVIDVFTDPWNPAFVVAAPNTYAHDVFVRDNIIYSSEISAGRLAIYDANDKDNIFLINTQPTPSTFTHNAWLSDDSNTIFTTDEVANAPVASYDISDLNNIEELDTYVPLETLGEGVIPHNVHVWQDWLIISYYSDGGIIVDAQYPNNLIEVGNFDTWFSGSGGFNGAWGAYPFLPSGLVLITDIQNGLYVLDADYVRACYLEGKVTNAINGANLPGVEINILSDQLNAATTDLFGDYATGQEQDGTFEVTFELTGFIPKTETVTLVNGELVVLDVELEPVGVVQGSVVRTTDGDPVPGAQVLFRGDEGDFFATADGSGTFSLFGILPGEYDVYAGAWGYVTSLETLDIANGGTVELEVAPGYYDDFILDLGWESESDANATSGFWEWGVPIEITFNGNVTTPGFDVEDDFGDRCYVTGNGGGGGGNNDIDGGVVTLTSPNIDLSDYNEPILQYQTYFWNGGGGGGSGDPNDHLTVRVTNGTDQVDVEVITTNSTDWSEIAMIELSSLIELTDNMHVIFESEDQQNTGHIVEASVDFFQIIEGNPVNTVDQLQQLDITVSPNPAISEMELAFDLSQFSEIPVFEVYNATGQLVEILEAKATQGRITFGETYQAGLYIIQLSNESGILGSLKVVKAE